MRHSYGKPLYNVMFPIWLLVWFPSWLWALLIPANYLIDHVVLWWSLGEMPDRKAFCRRHTWKICLAGFAGDFVGSLLLLGISLGIDTATSEWFYNLGMALMLNPFSNLGAFIITVAAIALAAFIIFFLDRLILRKAGLDDAQAKLSALYLAIVTAPYVFLFPMSLIY